MRCFVLMGVSGCGKSSVGKALEAECDLEFIDGDDLHTRENIKKMSDGVSLDDNDREPWLAAVGRRLAQHNGAIAVGCSALKRRYRDRIRAEAGEPVYFLHLDAPERFLRQRVMQRSNHFMPASLLKSQFETLERLQADELGQEIDITRPISEVLQQSEICLRSTMT